MIVIVVVLLFGLGDPVQPPTNVAMLSRNTKAAANRSGLPADNFRLRQKAQSISSSPPKIGTMGAWKGSERPAESPQIFGVLNA